MRWGWRYDRVGGDGGDGGWETLNRSLPRDENPTHNRHDSKDTHDSTHLNTAERANTDIHTPTGHGSKHLQTYI